LDREIEGGRREKAGTGQRLKLQASRALREVEAAKEERADICRRFSKDI
jgi:hypothetical protein